MASLHDRRIQVVTQTLRSYLPFGSNQEQDALIAGDLTVEDLARRALYAADKAVGIPDPDLAWDAYARTHFKLEGTIPTELERRGMRAAIGAAFWQETKPYDWAKELDDPRHS